MMTVVKQRMDEQLERDLRGRNAMPDLLECEAIVEKLLLTLREFNAQHGFVPTRGMSSLSARFCEGLPQRNLPLMSAWGHQRI